MIELIDVAKVYGKKASTFVALEDVNLKIADGASVAIVGKSGSGKSTLMHVMSGLDHATAGSIKINGTSLLTMKQRAMDQFRANEMSFIFQAFFIEPNQTCFQNVMLPLEIAEIPRRVRKQMVNDALEAVELGEKSGSYARNLSGGQKQRLAIARAIVNRPKLIFADEPTGNLDSATGEKIMDLLFDLNKTMGSTLIIVTHDHDLAARCQVQVHVKDGKIEKNTTAARRTAAPTHEKVRLLKGKINVL